MCDKRYVQHARDVEQHPFMQALSALNQLACKYRCSRPGIPRTPTVVECASLVPCIVEAFPSPPWSLSAPVCPICPTMLVIRLPDMQLPTYNTPYNSWQRCMCKHQHTQGNAGTPGFTLPAPEQHPSGSHGQHVHLQANNHTAAGAASMQGRCASGDSIPYG